MKAIWRTVLKLAIFLFVAEAAIMLILEGMQNAGLIDLLVPEWMVPWLDAALLVTLASPAIYFWVLRPQIAAERAKSRMLLVLSHELRNPLNGVLGMIDAVKDDIADDTMRSHLDIARTSALALTEKIDVLLHFAEGLDPGFRLAIVSAQSAEVLRQEARRSAAACAAKGLRFELKGAETANRPIDTDLKALQRILRVLLDNAVRYTDEGGVTLEVGLGRATETGSSRMEFVVRDTGPGLGTATRLALFRPFESGAVSHHRPTDGLRLGLPMAKWLARELGGSLEVLAAPHGSGTMAKLSLPVA